MTARRIGEPIAPLSEHRPELPATLCASLGACLDPDPDLRPGIGELREALLSARGGLHPDREVPDPRDGAALTPLPPQIPVRPFAVLIATGGIAVAGMLAGLPGLALVAAALLAPAVLMLQRSPEWLAGARAGARRDRRRPRLRGRSRDPPAARRPGHARPRSPGPGPESPAPCSALRSGSPTWQPPGTGPVPAARRSTASSRR